MKKMTNEDDDKEDDDIEDKKLVRIQ